MMKVVVTAIAAWTPALAAAAVAIYNSLTGMGCC